MADSQWISEVTEATFEEKVVQQSFDKPVVVDFWAGWCQPCQMLMPVLAKLVDEYNGEFLLAKVDTDAEQTLAARYRVRSLPTVKVFKDGEPVDEFTGVQPESQIRTIIDRYLVRESDLMHRKAVELYQAGQADQAIDLLRQAHAAAPHNTRLRVDLARLTAEQGDIEGALTLMEDMPADELDKPEIAGLRAQLRFLAKAGHLAPESELRKRLDTDPNDSEALYQLSLHRVMNRDFTGAMEGLLALMRKDRGYNDDAARKTLLELFEMLGPDEPMVKDYRRKLFTVLH